MGVRLVGGLEPGLAWQVTAGKHTVVQYLENTPVVFSLFIQVVHTDQREKIPVVTKHDLCPRGVQHPCLLLER